jgi:pimeloyl-ACP methyl ester carboxylesterase
VLLAPGLGYLAQRTRWFVRMMLRLGVSDRNTWDDATMASFVDRVAEPARARAGVQLYRTFNLRELLPLVRGRYDSTRLKVPTLLLFGSDDFAMTPGQLDGYERHADNMRVELVPGCGHFIADERPDVVAEHALAFLA